MKTALSIASEIVASKLREQPPGSNRGLLIDKIMRATGIEPPQPWCAAFVCWGFRQATGKPPEFNTASSQALKRWFESRGLLSYNPQDLLKWNGALFGWTNEDKAHGHIGFVKARFTTEGKVIAIGTLEGNTNRGGSRNGDGAYELRRNVPYNAAHRIWLLNTSAIEGGNWW